MTASVAKPSLSVEPQRPRDSACRGLLEADQLRLDRLVTRHAENRLAVPDIMRSGLILEPDVFKSTILGRLHEPGIAEVAFDRPFFVIYTERPPCIADPYGRTIGCEKQELLFLGDILKAQGFFEDAEFLYRSLLGDADASATAGRALGDLLLVQSGWATEFHAYAYDGRALDSVSRIGRPTWRDCTPNEAITCLRQTLAVEPGHPDTLFLLMTGLLRVGRWKEARRLARAYLAEREHVPDAGVLRIRTEFPLRPDEALKQGVRMFRKWRDGDGRRWHVEISHIRSAAEIAGSLPFYRQIDPPLLQPSCNVVIQDQQITSFDQPVPYDASYVAQVEEATILPLFGMIQADGRYLIAESLHHRSIHFSIFTNSVRAIADDRALLLGPEANRNDAEDVIFIGANSNYYHWLIDVLPRLRLMEMCDELKNRRILADRAIRPWQIELLALFGIGPERLLKADLSRPQVFRKLWMPSHLSTQMVAHPEAVRYVRTRLLGDATPATTKRGKRLYITRSSTSGRAMINAAAIEERFHRNGFISVDPGRMTIGEQIATFRDAEVVAGPGGAGLANAVFSPPSTVLLSLSSSDILCQTFASIAASIGQRSMFCAASVSLPRTYPHWIWTNFDYYVDPKDVDVCLGLVADYCSG